jgi:transcriptional regulator with XRE-family HTH domain
MRNAVHLSQAAVAKALGIKGPSVAQWEIGRSRPGVDKLPALARLYKVSLDDLCGTDLPLTDDARRSSSATAPDAGDFVDDPDEKALLRLWRALSHEKRVKLLLRVADIAAEDADDGAKRPKIG